MKLFNYYTEDVENKTIIRNEVSVDKESLKNIGTAIDLVMMKYESLTSREHKNDPNYNTNVVRGEFCSELSSLRYKVSCFIEKCVKEEEFFKVYSQLNNSTVNKSQERIKELELHVGEIVNKVTSTLNKGIVDFNSEIVDKIIDNAAKELKAVYYQIRRLSAFDSELEKHYQMLFNCISINPVETISIDDINKVKSFFGLDSSGTSYYENDKVRKIGIFKENKS